MGSQVTKNLLIFGVSLLALTSCSTPIPMPRSIAQDDQASRIFNDLVSANIISKNSYQVEGTALSPPSSNIVKALRELSKSTSPEGRQQAEKAVSKTISATGIKSHVCFRTPTPGAIIKTKLLSQHRPRVTATTNTSKYYPMTLGLYKIWSERNNEPTSDIKNTYEITTRYRRIDLEGDTSGVRDCEQK